MIASVATKLKKKGKKKKLIICICVISSCITNITNFNISMYIYIFIYLFIIFWEKNNMKKLVEWQIKKHFANGVVIASSEYLHTSDNQYVLCQQLGVNSSHKDVVSKMF